MADDNNNNNCHNSGIGQVEVEQSLAAVENLLNNLQAGDTAATDSLEHAVQEACHVINLATNNNHMQLERAIVLKALKALLARIDTMHGDMQGQLNELQGLMSNTSSSANATRAYIKASTNKPTLS